MRALATLLAVLACVAVCHGQASVMFAGDALTGSPVAVEGAPHWRLDRAFQRTCVTLICTGGKARHHAKPRAKRPGAPHAHAS